MTHRIRTTVAGVALLALAALAGKCGEQPAAPPRCTSSADGTIICDQGPPPSEMAGR